MISFPQHKFLLLLKRANLKVGKAAVCLLQDVQDLIFTLAQSIRVGALLCLTGAYFVLEFLNSLFIMFHNIRKVFSPRLKLTAFCELLYVGFEKLNLSIELIFFHLNLILDPMSLKVNESWKT
jgi:hypothetical protein